MEMSLKKKTLLRTMTEAAMIDPRPRICCLGVVAATAIISSCGYSLLLLQSFTYLGACASASMNYASASIQQAEQIRAQYPIKTETTEDIRCLHHTNHQSNTNGTINNTSSCIFLGHSPHS